MTQSQTARITRIAKELRPLQKKWYKFQCLSPNEKERMKHLQKELNALLDDIVEHDNKVAGVQAKLI